MACAQMNPDASVEAEVRACFFLMSLGLSSARMCSNDVNFLTFNYFKFYRQFQGVQSILTGSSSLDLKQ